MTVVTAIFFPIVLLYQGWTFYVFRKRIDVADLRGGQASGPAAPGPSAPGPAAPGSPGASPAG